jgi:hypothetical protein
MPKSHVIFDPQQLRSVRDLQADGTIPYHWKTVERMCREGDLPAIKVGNRWCSTKDAVRNHLWKSANAAFKRAHA